MADPAGSLAAEARRRLKAAGMDPDTDPLAPVVEVMVQAADTVARGISPETERDMVERVSSACALAAERAMGRAGRAMAWRSGILAACGLLVALGLGYWLGGAAARQECTVVQWAGQGRACIIVVWRD